MFRRTRLLNTSRPRFETTPARQGPGPDPSPLRDFPPAFGRGGRTDETSLHAGAKKSQLDAQPDLGPKWAAAATERCASFGERAYSGPLTTLTKTSISILLPVFAKGSITRGDFCSDISMHKIAMAGSSGLQKVHGIKQSKKGCCTHQKEWRFMNSEVLSEPSGLSDGELLEKVMLLARGERDIIVRLVAHLVEMQRRKLFLARGCIELGQMQNLAMVVGRQMWNQKPHGREMHRVLQAFSRHLRPQSTLRTAGTIGRIPARGVTRAQGCGTRRKTCAKQAEPDGAAETVTV
jgi:hypothetical protein